MKWITFLSWYFSNDNEDTIIRFKDYQIIETEDISVFDINNFRYPSVSFYGEKIVSSSFWCFWDTGHITYCVLMVMFIYLLSNFWGAMRILFIDRLIVCLKNRILENKRKNNGARNKKEILKVGNKRIAKKQKHN